MLILKHSFKHSLKLSSEPFAAPKAYAGLVIVGSLSFKPEKRKQRLKVNISDP